MVVIMIFIVISQMQSVAQVSVVWDHIHDVNYEEGRLIVADTSNNVWYVADRGTVVKLDHYGDTLLTTVVDTATECSPVAMTIDNNHKLIIIANGHESPNIKYYIVSKFDLSGDLLWTLKVANPDPELIEMELTAMDLDSNNNIYLTGSNGTQHWSYFYTAKISHQGNIIWESNYESPFVDEITGNDIVVYDSNNIYATGFQYHAMNLKDAVMNKYDFDGNLLWTDTFNYWEYYGNYASNFTFGDKVDVDMNNNAYMLGSGIYGQYPFLIKYNTEGQRQWIVKLDSVNYISYSLMEIDSNSIYLSSGQSDESRKVSVKEYNFDGEQIWHYVYDSVGMKAKSMLLQYDGIVITGYNDLYTSDKDFQCTFKLDRNGNYLWMQKVDNFSAYSDDPFDITQDYADGIYVTGQGVNGFNQGFTYKLFECDKINAQIEIMDDHLEANYIPGAYYLWYNCTDSIIDVWGKAMTQFYPPNDTTYYKAKVYMGTCVDSTECVSLTSVNIASVTDESRVIIYPNPVSGEFSIAIPEGGLADVFIYDIRGQLIVTYPDFNTLSRKAIIEAGPGVYLVEVIKDEKRWRSKVVVI